MPKNRLRKNRKLTYRIEVYNVTKEIKLPVVYNKAGEVIRPEMMYNKVVKRQRTIQLR